MKNVMNVLPILWVLVFQTVLAPVASNAVNESFPEQLSKALEVAQTIVTMVHREWEIDKYPNFLMSCFMHKPSWQLLKLRFQEKIMRAAVSNVERSKFIISFTGTSATATHRSSLNASVPNLTCELMQPTMSALNIELHCRDVSTSAAIPCIPYDVCINEFAGFDADIVNWERTVLCGDHPVIEQVIRQASSSPSKPIVVFSESHTATWSKEECSQASTSTSHELTEHEKALLTATPLQWASEYSRQEHLRVFGSLDKFIHLYHGAGIQTFHHDLHKQHQCLGPYIPDWASQPILSYRLRAAHYAYFWLLIWTEAIQDLQPIIERRSLQSIHRNIILHALKVHDSPMAPKYDFPFSDGTKCLTDLLPRTEISASLRNRVVFGFEDFGPESSGWNGTVYEDVMRGENLKRVQELGFSNFQWLLHGNNISGAISIHINIEKEGPLFVCQMPANLGKLPVEFSDLWAVGAVSAFVTYDVLPMELKKFRLNLLMKRTKEHTLLFHPLLESCAQVRVNEFTPNIPIGSHVLSLVPQSQKHVMLGWVLHS